MCEKVNKIKLIKLYSMPKMFEEITFNDGLNIILGEKSENNGDSKNNKTNGVGKSVCIDFINFMLLKEYKETRLSKISPIDLDVNTIICLELKIGEKKITVKRKLSTPDKVTFILEGREYNFEKLREAIEFVETLFFNKKDNDISFRNFISSVTREEKTNFSNILRYYSNTKIPNDPTPLLYMLNIDITKINLLNDIKRKYDKQCDIRNESKKSLVSGGGMSITEIKAELNEKENRLKESERVIEQLKSNAVYKGIEDDIINLESTLKILCDDRMIIKMQIKQIDSLPTPEKINESEMREVYNYYKSGLGDYITKSLEEVNSFKNVIEKYQETLISIKMKELKKNLNDIEEKIRELEKIYTDKMKLVSTDGSALNYIETGLNVYNKEYEEFNEKKALYSLYNQTSIKIENIKTEYANGAKDLVNNINDMSTNIDSLEKTLTDFNFDVMGDRYCSLSIKPDTKITTKNIVNAEVRITDDGSFSVDRIKVFLYDMALMFNEYTRKNHPGFIIHDNIFHFDDDSTEKCLELLITLGEQYSDFQYITTLNIDDFNNLEVKDKLFKDRVIAKFTKMSKFLGITYKEI